MKLLLAGLALASIKSNILRAADGSATGGVLDAELRGELTGAIKTFKESAAKLDAHEKSFGTLTAELKELQEGHKAFELALAEAKKNQLAIRSAMRSVRPGEVTEDCARYLGALFIRSGINQEKINGKSGERLRDMADEILGKTAVASSDIPLPVDYSGQVVELVSLYGAARRFGTVFPLTSGTVKLPKLTTSPAFTLIASSGSVGEKVPQTAWVTFTPEKFGGVVRLPSEIDEDSIIPIGQFVARYAAREMAKAEDTQFFISSGAGSGANGSVEGLTYSTITNSKVVQMASTKTKYSDATLANLRALRAVPDAAALGMSAYYFHPSFEQLLSTFNSSGDRPYNPNAQIAGNGANPITTGPTLDGFPIRWVDILPAYSTSNNASKVFALFGDVSYQYLGVRGGLRFDTSREVYFATDEIGIRALQRMTIGLMATGAVAGLETAAS